MKFGPYTVLEKIGRGAMGMVYLATDEGGREVGLKVLKARRAASPEAIEQFRNEARIAASLKHPNIVPIHTFGQIDGKYYYTMDFIDGFPLTKLIDDDVITPEKSARIAADLAAALHFAHEKGVTHSDIKPANILIDGASVPLIADFGLARKAGKKEVFLEGQGTPAYMSPEQASGAAEITPLTDVFSLGAVLFEMLTGRPPHEGKTANDVMMQAARGDVPLPSTINPYIPDDLEAVIRKAMARKPEDRYETAAAMEQDLRRFLRGERVGARAGRPFLDALLSSRRGTGLAVAASVLALVLPFLIVFLVRKANAPSVEELAITKAVTYRIDAAVTYIEKDMHLMGEKQFAQAESLTDTGVGRHLIDTRHHTIQDNRSLLASRYLTQGFRHLEARAIAEAEKDLRILKTIPFQEKAILERIDTLLAKISAFRADAEQDEKDIQKVRALAKVTNDLSVLARAWRTYLKAHSRGLHTKEAYEALEKIFPLYVPGLDIGPLGKRFFNLRDGAELSYVPPGSFIMGSNRGFLDERPEHKIVLAGYYIYRHEVTNRLFAAFLNESGAKAPTHPIFAGTDTALKPDDEGKWTYPSEVADLPVVGVTWFGAAAYAAQVGAALPTEAQWERAARGEDGNLYPWGDDWNWRNLNSISYWAKEDLMSYQWDMSDARKSEIYSAAVAMPVGSFSAGISSSSRCYDLAGNVREWCRDSYEKKYYARDDRPRKDPVNNLDSGFKVLRGGSFSSPGDFCGCSIRQKKDPSTSSFEIGFRCVFVARTKKK
jgi:formylglycine-generating enzyme required for sulfatase activity